MKYPNTYQMYEFIFQNKMLPIPNNIKSKDNSLKQKMANVVIAYLENNYQNELRIIESFLHEMNNELESLKKYFPIEFGYSLNNVNKNQFEIQVYVKKVLKPENTEQIYNNNLFLKSVGIIPNRVNSTFFNEIYAFLDSNCSTERNLAMIIPDFYFSKELMVQNMDELKEYLIKEKMNCHFFFQKLTTIGELLHNPIINQALNNWNQVISSNDGDFYKNLHYLFKTEQFTLPDLWEKILGEMFVIQMNVHQKAIPLMDGKSNFELLINYIDQNSSEQNSELFSWLHTWKILKLVQHFGYELNRHLGDEFKLNLIQMVDDCASFSRMIIPKDLAKNILYFKDEYSDLNYDVAILFSTNLTQKSLPQEALFLPSELKVWSNSRNKQLFSIDNQSNNNHQMLNLTVAAYNNENDTLVPANGNNFFEIDDCRVLNWQELDMQYMKLKSENRFENKETATVMFETFLECMKYGIPSLFIANSNKYAIKRSVSYNELQQMANDFQNMKSDDKKMWEKGASIQSAMKLGNFINCLPQFYNEAENKSRVRKFFLYLVTDDSFNQGKHNEYIIKLHIPLCTIKMLKNDLPDEIQKLNIKAIVHEHCCYYENWGIVVSDKEWNDIALSKLYSYIY